MTSAIPGGLRRERNRRPERIVSCRKLKASRHHADDGISLAVQVEWLADDAVVTAEPSLPERVTQHYYMARTGLVLRAGECTPELWRDAEQWEEVRGDETSFESFRFARAGQVETFIRDRGHAFEECVLIAPVDEVCRRRRVVWVAKLGGILPHHYQAFGILVRQGPQQDRVH